MKKEFVGIDVSKSTLDVCLYHLNEHKIFKNNLTGISAMYKWVVRRSAYNEIGFCFEHTGLYSIELAGYLQEKQSCFYMVSGLAVKRSMGLMRGKSDKTDAKALAKYAFRHKEELSPTILPCKTISELKDLLTLRLRMVRELAGYKAYVKEYKSVFKLNENELRHQAITALSKVFKQNIKDLEKQILELIKTDEQLNKVYENITSIKGIGFVVAVNMIVITNNFQAFETWRKLACYAGTVPFEHQSGTSYRGKTRVSHLSNKYLKSILSQAAASAIQYNPEMKIYYQKRLQDGKSKMSALNIIRNKLISRMFAVAKRGTPYVDIHKFAA